MTDRQKKPSSNSHRPHPTLKTKLLFALQIFALLVPLLAFGAVGFGGIAIMFTDIKGGAILLGLSSVMVLILGYILVKGISNFRKLGYFWDPPPSLTEVDVNTIPLRSGPADIVVNPVNGYVYVATDDRSVLLMDPTTDKIVAQNQKELSQSPLKLSLDTASNQIVALLKKGTLVKLDGTSLTNSKSLLSFPYNLNSIVVNSKLQRAYLASEPAKAVFVYDIKSDSVIKKIDFGYSPSGIAVDSAKGRVFVAYTQVAGVSVIDEASLEMIEQIGFPVPGAAASFSADVYVNPGNQMVYVLLRSILMDGNGGGHELDSLYVFDGAAKTFVDCRSCRLDWKSQTLLSDDGHNYLAVDPGSGTVFLTNISKKRLFALPSQGGEPLYSLKIGSGCSGIGISPYAKKAYVCYKGLFGKNRIDVISL